MTDFGPLDLIVLRSNENGMPPLMVLCRAPANDGWIAIEAGTAVIYNLFDPIVYLYKLADSRDGLSSLGTRANQAALLARAQWFHHPEGIETVSAPRLAA